MLKKTNIPLLISERSTIYLYFVRIQCYNGNFAVMKRCLFILKAKVRNGGASIDTNLHYIISPSLLYIILQIGRSLQTSPWTLNVSRSGAGVAFWVILWYMWNN